MLGVIRGTGGLLRENAMTFAPVAPTIDYAPRQIAADTWLIQQVQPALGQPLFVYLNSLVILAEEPVIVDTGTPANRRQWLEDVFSIVEPADVRWVFLSHDDVDHTGNLEQVMNACPNATMVVNWPMHERHTNAFNFPLERCIWNLTGDSFDVGDRTLVAVRPPCYDSPTTRGLFDPKTGLYWCVDTLATPVPAAPTENAVDLEAEFWAEGIALFAYGALCPWLSIVDPAKYAETVADVQNLDIELIAGCHTPIVDGPRIEQAFRMLRELPLQEPPPLPDQSVLDEIVAATSEAADS
jgi:flavorubredoxin